MDRVTQRPLFSMRRVRVVPTGGISFVARMLTGIVLLAVGSLSGNAAASEPHTKATYSYSLPARDILEQLDQIKLGTPPTITAEEWQVLDAAWALREASDDKKHGQEYDQLVIRALLTASGIQTKADMAAYLQKLDQVIEKAREAVKQEMGTQHPGETLMRFLHSELMAGEYDAGQSSFSGVFDTHRYNCLSSTALYYVVGNSLGLKMRIISIPGGFIFDGHVCIDILHNGMVFEVEPTCEDGFDWGRKSKEPGVRLLGYQPDRKDGYEIDPLELAALVYSNRGVIAAKEVQSAPLVGVSLGLRGAMVSPNARTIRSNVETTLVNWGKKLAEEGRYDEGIRVLAYGCRATGAASIREHLTSIWSEYIMLLMIERKDHEAQAAIERARHDLPNETDFQKGRCWIDYIESQFHGSATGREAVESANRALAVVPESDRSYILEKRTSIVRRWSQYFLDEQNIDGALKALATGYELDRNDRELHQGIAYFVQEALDHVDSKGANPKAAVSQFATIRAVFPGTNDISEVSEAHVQRSLDSLAAEKKFEQAFAAARVYAPLARSPKEEIGFIEQVWEQWGEFYLKSSEYERGIDTLAQGLSEIPQSQRIKDCVESYVDRWADVKIEPGDWDAAIKIYDRGLQILPNSTNLKINRDRCIRYKAETVSN